MSSVKTFDVSNRAVQVICAAPWGKECRERMLQKPSTSNALSESWVLSHGIGMAKAILRSKEA